MKLSISRQVGYFILAFILLLAILSHEIHEFKKYKLGLIHNYKTDQRLLVHTFTVNYQYLMAAFSTTLEQLDRHFQKFGVDHTLEQFDFLAATEKEALAFSALYDDHFNRLHISPGPEQIAVDDRNIKVILDTAAIPEYGYVSSRLFAKNGESLVLLIKPMVLHDARFYLVTGIRIGQFTRSCINRWQETNHSFFLVNRSGEILSLYNAECDSIQYMVRGNIYHLGPRCQPCHSPGEFDYFQDVTDSLSCRIHRYAKGNIDLRSLVAMPFLNENWVLCAEGPYDDILTASHNTAQSIFIDMSLLLIVFGGVIFLFLRGQRQQAFLEAETREYKKFHDIIDHMEEGCFETDIRGTFTFVNIAMERIFGYSRQELLGMTNRDFMSPDAASRIYKDVNTVFRSGKALHNVRWEIQTKTGEMCIAESSVSPRMDSNGKIIGFRGVLRDVTEQIRATKALEKSEKEHRQLSKKLAQTVSTKDLLLDIISHDVKNPASAILGFSDLLLEEYPKIEELKYIRDASAQLINMVKNASTLIRLEKDEELPLETVPIGERVYWQAKEFSLQHRDLTIDNHIPEDFTIRANPIIEEVLRNYIGNAMKYANDGKRIVIAVEQRPGRVLFSVADWGKTIAAELREKIFKRNFQVNKGRGQGLGLAIAAKIARAHGGRVWSEPNEPKGNIFYLEIPQPEGDDR
ncbi:MAG: PAS domain S-box protein [Fidelibacterota bacterium]